MDYIEGQKAHVYEWAVCFDQVRWRPDYNLVRPFLVGLDVYEWALSISGARERTCRDQPRSEWNPWSSSRTRVARWGSLFFRPEMEVSDVSEHGCWWVVMDAYGCEWMNRRVASGWKERERGIWLQWIAYDTIWFSDYGWLSLSTIPKRPRGRRRIRREVLVDGPHPGQPEAPECHGLTPCSVATQLPFGFAANCLFVFAQTWKG